MYASIEEKLSNLGIVVPAPQTPTANYVLVTRVGNVLHVCGHNPFKPDGSLVKGKLGQDVSVEQGYESARLCAIQILGTLKQELGSLDRVRRILKVSI